jgi:predicted P-loop ATPase
VGAWQAIDDVVIAKLKVRFLRTGTRFRVGNEFLKETLLAIAHENQHDPVVERINGLVWDRQPRLVTWLSYTCGVPCDPYHQAVGKNVIGGMVKRARRPAPSTTR